MANEKNLKKFKKGDVSHDEAVRRGSLGGKTRAKNIKKRKTLREMLEILLEKQIENPYEKGKKQTTLEAISVSLIQKALLGNVKAFEVLRDTIGQKPVEKVEVNSSELVKQGLNKINEYFTDNKE